ncbi:hypothetical protein DFP72DRAFT_1174964 [Ephemerocybe angulata]|uniref:Uncharacterized protein n=1 Tax=Ephemerocybe angulata TaxID=980116 RepID=A0A8H6M015_9AGAR|nr:hypothetical protein DFP72DRAFT_1174964 [Tulosesus angulatus]
MEELDMRVLYFHVYDVGAKPLNLGDCHMPVADPSALGLTMRKDLNLELDEQLFNLVVFLPDLSIRTLQGLQLRVIEGLLDPYRGYELDDALTFIPRNIRTAPVSWEGLKLTLRAVLECSCPRTLMMTATQDMTEDGSQNFADRLFDMLKDPTFCDPTSGSSKFKVEVDFGAASS